MPNWCHNEVTIHCTSSDEYKEIKNFLASEKQEFDFEKIVPMPEHIFRGNLGKEEEEKYGKENCWYDWCCENWDTKWNACDVSFEDDPGHQETLEYEFDTAWSPPANIYRTLKNKFPGSSIFWFYREDGMEFSGYLHRETDDE